MSQVSLVCTCRHNMGRNVAMMQSCVCLALPTHAHRAALLHEIA